MDMSGNEKLDMAKRTTVEQCSSSLAPIAPPSSIDINPVIQMAASPCTSIPMADSFTSDLWIHQPLVCQSLAFGDSLNSHATNHAPACQLMAMSSRGMLFPAVPGFIQPSLSHFTSDTAFVDGAARFSCFNVGNLSGLANSLGPHPAMATYASILKEAMGDQPQKSGFKVAEVRGVSMHVDHGPNTLNPLINQRENGNSHVSVSNSGIHEDNFTEAGQAARASSPDTIGDSSPSVLGAKKRKRTDQSIELDQVQHVPSSSLDITTKIAKSKLKPEWTSPKSGDKNVKDSSEAPKEDYVHVRARRGQATNSHSLAERVRREKISERMKYLQDLVPGCSKVTGKAVMLDEIINYVQSLQRQVEFLSMKLATVNPSLDFNIEGSLAKDFLYSYGNPFSPSGFPHIHPQLHASQRGFGQVGTSCTVNPSDALRTTRSTNMNGYKDPILQMQNPWNEEFYNVMQMTYNANPPLDAQGLNSEHNDGFQI